MALAVVLFEELACCGSGRLILGIDACLVPQDCITKLATVRE